MSAPSRERWSGLRHALDVLDRPSETALDPIVAVEALHWGVSYRQPRLDAFEDIDHDL